MLSVEYEEEMPFLPSCPYYFYKITCNDAAVNKCYIGKTKCMKTRESTHKCNSKFSDINLYQVIRENGGWINWKMEVVHKCICDEIASTYIECALIKQFREKGFDVLNKQLPQNYPKQEYNKQKCKEHYQILKNCDCGWVGSKMEWSHHLKSKRHIWYLSEMV